MWLTDCFLVTFFGRWRGAVRIHVSHVWLTCTVMPSRVAFNQWWRGAPHVQLMCGSRTAHVWLTCTVMPSRVAFNQWWRGAPHIQLTCGSAVWLMYSSRVVWRGAPHVQLTCGSHVHGNALTCSIQSMVEGSPSRTAHVWLTYSAW